MLGSCGRVFTHRTCLQMKFRICTQLTFVYIEIVFLPTELMVWHLLVCPSCLLETTPGIFGDCCLPCCRKVKERPILHQWYESLGFRIVVVLRHDLLYESCMGVPSTNVINCFGSWYFELSWSCMQLSTREVPVSLAAFIYGFFPARTWGPGTLMPEETSPFTIRTWLPPKPACHMQVRYLDNSLLGNSWSLWARYDATATRMTGQTQLHCITIQRTVYVRVSCETAQDSPSSNSMTFVCVKKLSHHGLGRS